jgi:hypothetical protein
VLHAGATPFNRDAFRLEALTKNQTEPKPHDWVLVIESVHCEFINVVKKQLCMSGAAFR